MALIIASPSAMRDFSTAFWYCGSATAANMQTYMRSVASAQQAYVLSNGEQQPAELDELAISLNGFTEGTKLGGIATTLNAYNDLFEIRVGVSSVIAYFISGKYKGCGFVVNTSTNRWNCWEWHYYYEGTAGEFCQKIMNAGAMTSDQNNVRSYPL